MKSRLADSKYAELGYRNLASPVIRLRRLSDNELLALVRRLTKLYAQREGLDTPPLTDEQITAFMIRWDASLRSKRMKNLFSCFAMNIVN